MSPRVRTFEDVAPGAWLFGRLRRCELPGSSVSLGIGFEGSSHLWHLVGFVLCFLPVVCDELLAAAPAIEMPNA